jgi:hypothetical protein
VAGVDALTSLTYLSCGITPSYINHIAALPLYFRLQSIRCVLRIIFTYFHPAYGLLMLSRS